MKLFLASEAKHPTSFKKLDDFVGGIKGKKIAYIPTALNGEKWESWKAGGTWKLLNTLDINLNTILLEDFGNSRVVGRILENDIVWFGGGMVGYLLYWMKRCKIDKHLEEILKQCVYVGSSAGSMVLCKNAGDLVEWDFVDSESGASEIKSLGFLNFDIFPHFEDHLYEKIERRYRGNKMYLLKNGEEIIVDNGRIEVVGEERIITNN